MTVDVNFELMASLNDHLEEGHKFRNKMKQDVYTVTIVPQVVPLVSGAGTLDDAPLLGPVHGFRWSIRRLTLWGYSAGTATAYINNVEPIPFSAQGMQTFGRSELCLFSGDRLTVQATGITGSVTLYGSADVVAEWYWPYYIG